MCHFITLIVSTDDAQAVDALMRRHERRGTPICNASVASSLCDGEYQYLTTAGHCDCGTVLVRRHRSIPQELEEKRQLDAAKMRRKKWGDAKIARWIDERRKAMTKPAGGEEDSIEQWASIIRALKNELQIPSVGLFIHFYDGSISDGVFKTSRNSANHKLTLPEQLAELAEDQVTIFN